MPESLAQTEFEAAAIAHPLDRFYARSGLPLPALRRLAADQVPEPYHSLLVHRRDMTSTLESFHGESVHLHVVGRDRSNGEYFREVVLRLDGNDRPVEFGAIKINLDLFPKAAQAQILKEHLPLGRILKDCVIDYSSQPQAYLRITSDAMMNDLLALRQTQALYGRRNTLFDPQGRRLAEIVEILPPIQTS